MKNSLPNGEKMEWRHFAAVHSALRPPLRPSPEDVQIAANAIEGRDNRVLLLGVTPELSILGRDLTAVDNSPRMLAKIWPGDCRNRRAELADWTRLPFQGAQYDSVLGDGAINSAPEALELVLNEVRRVLVPFGTAVFRVFCSPEEPESFAAIAEDALKGRAGNVHAVKWRIAMSLASPQQGRIVPVRDILSAFNTIFADRVALAIATGWDESQISTVDAYDGADHCLGFPTRQEIISLMQPLFSTVRCVLPSGYPLAERCPTIVAIA